MGVFIIIFFEVVLVAFTVWGILHENRLIEFERRTWEKIKRRIRIKKRDLCAKWLADDGLVVQRPSRE